MVSKTDVGLLAVGLVVLVAASKQIGGFFSKVGGSIGGSIEQGVQSFVSSLSGGLIPTSMQQDMQMQQQQTMQQQQMPPSGGETPAQAAVIGTGAVAAMMAIKAGAADALLSPKTGAVDIKTNTLTDFFNMLTGRFPNITEQIPTAANELLQYLQKGGTSIEDFVTSFKFPSGLTLNEILGGAGKGITPEAFGDTGMPIAGVQLVDPNTLPSKMSAAMMQVANLNIDKKIDTPYGVITTGGNPNSIGAGKGTILPPQTLDQVLQQHPELSASQAADLLFRMMGSKTPNNFDFGSNTGSGVIAMFMPPVMMGGLPVVSGLENNPVLKAYEAYKAMYGLM